MKNFELFLPTRYQFGAGVVQKVGAEAGKLGRRALLVSGKSSASRSGLLATVETLLKAEGLFVCSLGGVDPNPRLSTCVAGARLCKEHAIDVVVAVGGGSVLDASKTIAALALDGGEPWDFFTGARPITRALPLVGVLTVAATGSEYGPYAVITNEKTGEKLGTFGEAIIPRVSIVDPSLTFTVPARHTAFGAIDIISHHLEAYLACEEAPLIQDELTEVVIRSVIAHTGRALADPEDLEARSCLLWANTLACGVFMAGRGAMRFDAHAVEHELSAAYDVPHGAGLAVILPALMRWRAEKDPARVERFARQVFGVSGNRPARETALAGIQAFRDWCRSVGAPVTLAELGVPREAWSRHAENVAGTPDGKDLGVAAVMEILSYAA